MVQSFQSVRHLILVIQNPDQPKRQENRIFDLLVEKRVKLTIWPWKSIIRGYLLNISFIDFPSITILLLSSNVLNINVCMIFKLVIFGTIKFISVLSLVWSTWASVVVVFFFFWDSILHRDGGSFFLKCSSLYSILPAAFVPFLEPVLSNHND